MQLLSRKKEFWSKKVLSPEKTLEKGLKYVQSYQYGQQNDVNSVILLLSLLLTLNIFHTF